MKKLWTMIFASLVTIVALVPFFIFFSEKLIQHEQAVAPQYPLIDFTKTKELKAGEKFSVKSVTVIDGNSFYLDLVGGYRIKALVPLVIKDEAASFVAEALQKASEPAVVLKGLYKGEIWIVEFDFTFNGKPTKLDTLLRQNGLIFE